jgi:metal-responsive CopG/Arc/MetJ family transcriptional regulator
MLLTLQIMRPNIRIVGVSMDVGLLREIDVARGDVNRSKFIRKLAERGLKERREKGEE